MTATLIVKRPAPQTRTTSTYIMSPDDLRVSEELLISTGKAWKVDIKRVTPHMCEAYGFIAYDFHGTERQKQNCANVTLKWGGA